MTSRVQNQILAFKRTYPWITSPLIIGAPMRVFAGASLATAVSRAGGIGFMGQTAKPSELDSLFVEARKLLNNPPGKEILPIGIGFQTFDADLQIASQVVEEHVPAAVWLFAPRNGQQELDTWTEKLRSVSPNTQIWIQVGSVSDAVKAARSKIPPDVLVLQGIDAGGHGLARAASIVSLVPEVADALAELDLVKDIPIVAAGGIADGRGVAAALGLGAMGAVMGTRFLAAEEAKVARGYQADVVRTTDGGQNTVRTTLYDELAGRTNWPREYDGRNVVNGSWVDRESGLGYEENKIRYEEATKKGDEGRMTSYVGSAVGLVREVSKAEDIVRNTREEARCALGRVNSLL